MQMKMILSEMEHEASRGGRILVHCGGGKGRAGTVLACWMVRHGLETYSTSRDAPKMGGEEAVRVLRHMRPGQYLSSAAQKSVAFRCYSRNRWVGAFMYVLIHG